MSERRILIPSALNSQSNSRRSTPLVVLFALTVALTSTSSFGQTITSIRDFGEKTGDPLNPQYVGLIAQGRDGDMYSTTPRGGTNALGAAFRITPGGALTVIHNFTAAEGTPYSGFTLGTDGNFYGTTFNGGTSKNCTGGCGTIFRMTRAGALTVLYNFTGGNDGKNPYAPPVEGTDGKYYGTTSAGGTDGFGTVYAEASTGGLPTSLVQFTGTDGDKPVGPLVQASDGNFYGTTTLGNNNCGFDNICATVFKVTPNGTFTQLHSFPFNSFHNFIFANGLALGLDGNLYGTVVESGTANGELFRITTKGVFTDLYDFMAGNDGASPYAGLVTGTDGRLYGVALTDGADGFGTVFNVTSVPKFTLVAPMSGTNGASPSVTMIQHTNGFLYGDANAGGAVTNTGTFFRVSGLALEKPFVSLLPRSGNVGTTIGILGQGFTGSTAVSFNGTAAKFTVVSSTYMTAVVPTGATSGFVTVTTPTATLKSNRGFVVK